MQREYKEYIEREGAKELLRIWITDCVLDGDNDAADCYRDCIDLLDSIPAADVVEVVRCRECVHWKPTGSKAGNPFSDSDMEYIGGCEFTKYCRRESDFCSYGERKGGAD